MTRFSLGFVLLYLINIDVSAQSKIIFSRSSGGLNTGGTLDLMIYNPGDKSTKLLLKGTVSGRGEYNVATSPDNSKIVFSTYRFSGWKLGIGDFKDETITNVRQLVTGSDYRYNIKYSPNGLKIVYQEYSWSSGNTNIMIADQDGKNVTPLVKDKGHNRTPDWLRNGQTIIFSSARGDSHCIYSKEVTGRNLKELTDNKGNDFAPSASRVEDKIAFLSDREGKVNLYVMDIDGGNKIKLTATLKSDPFRMTGFQDSGGWAYKTCWSPDGKQIVFDAMVNGNMEIFIVNSDGSGLAQITSNSDSDISPYWMN